jgi:uncharacterized protein (DUF2267 family)
MQFDQFIGLVQHRAQLSSEGKALTATKATLEVLGERLFGGEASDFAAQLPLELKSYVIQFESGQSFDLEEFFGRISDREGVDIDEAMRHARAVLSVVAEAVSYGEIEDALAQLPEEWHYLFRHWGETIRKAA